MPLFRPGIDNNSQHPRRANGEATSEEQDVADQMRRVVEADSPEPVTKTIEGTVGSARANIATIVQNTTNETSEVPSLALLEAQRDSLRGTIKNVDFDLTNPENSGATEWDLRLQKKNAEQELLKVEQQITKVITNDDENTFAYVSPIV